MYLYMHYLVSSSLVLQYYGLRLCSSFLIGSLSHGYFLGRQVSLYRISQGVKRVKRDPIVPRAGLAVVMTDLGEGVLLKRSPPGIVYLSPL